MKKSILYFIFSTFFILAGTFFIVKAFSTIDNPSKTNTLSNKKITNDSPTNKIFRLNIALVISL